MTDNMMVASDIRIVYFISIRTRYYVATTTTEHILTELKFGKGGTYVVIFQIMAYSI